MWFVRILLPPGWVEVSLVTSICEEEHLEIKKTAKQGYDETNFNGALVTSCIAFATGEDAHKFADALKKKLPKISTCISNQDI